jgi:amidase
MSPLHPAAAGASLDRRDFLAAAAATAAGALLPHPLGAQPHALPATPDAAIAHPVPPFEFEEATIADLQAAMASRKHTALSITVAYLDRIADLDRRGPALRHMLDLNPDALAIARRLDAERRAGRLRGPLHGIPIIIKDNIDTADRMTTTAGSLALEGSIASRDAFLVERLREAGAVILGKANLTEWANFRSTRASSGWSSRGGQGRNPYALDRSPCGSSSGTGGGIAANYAAVGVGTETDGSIVCPSAAMSLVGIKPTLGLVSRSGIIPIAHSQDTAGPMARTVTDAAILLGIIAGADRRDPETVRVKVADYTKSLDPRGLAGARIGVARERLFGYSEETDRIAETALAAMKDAGAELIDPADIPNLGDYDDGEFTVLLYEFKADLNTYLAGLGPKARVKSLADAIRFNEEHRVRTMPYFGQEIFHMAQEKGALTERAYRDALARNRRLAREKGIDQVMTRHRLDALVAPTGHPVWPIDLVNGDHFLGASSTAPAVAGYPNITVPAGFAFGLPVGVSFIGPAWSEPTLIRLAFAFEQATRVRRAPAFPASARL